MSNWLGVLTIASATLGLVSETRVMFDPTVSSVERPTNSVTSEVSLSAAAAVATTPSPVKRALAGCTT